MRTALALPIAFFMGTAAAQGIVIYRCTDATGAVTFQNDVRCPKGSKQEKRIVEAPAARASAAQAAAAAPSPTPATPSSKVAPATDAQSSVPATAPTKSAPAPASAQTPTRTPQPAMPSGPPPALYRCINYKRETYVSETDLQPSRCVPLQAVGLDGNAATGAGAVCERIRDSCEPIAESVLCDAWRKRHEEAQAAARFGTGEQAEKARAILSRSQSIVSANCSSD